MTTLTRRHALLTLMGGAAGRLLAPAADDPKHSRLGVVSYALGIHQRNKWGGRHEGVAPAVTSLEQCHALGAGGIQHPFAASDILSAREVRRRAEQYGMHVEAIVEPPHDVPDAGRFGRAVSVAVEAGATVARTVIMPGRRYEQFKTLDEFRQAEVRGMKPLQLAKPILARHKFSLAVENHKDHLIGERLKLLRKIGIEYVGLGVDVINDFALLEDPVETVRAFAPFAVTVHIKDQDIREYEEGFRLSDEALGEGFLYLPKIVGILREAKPDVRFNLETITRDPIKVPVRTDG